MVYVIERPEDRILSPEEFVSYVDANVDVDSTESILEHAWALRALANDRDFVLDALHSYASAVADGSSNPGRGGASIVLSERERFYLRANIWLPDHDRSRDEESVSFYSYDLPHDHNYTFLTVGYYGGGYRTTLFRYNYDDVSGVPSEPSGASYAGEEQLTPGKMILYECGRDIHIQHPPDTTSVSLNLIVRPQLGIERQQYIFSSDASTILSGSADTLTSRLCLIDFCLHCSDKRTVQLLKMAVIAGKCDRTKAYALSVLRRIDPEAAAWVSTSNDLPAAIVARSFEAPLLAEVRLS